MKKDLHSNQKSKIRYLSDGCAEVICFQDKGTPGTYRLVEVKPNTKYRLKFKGYKIGKNPIQIWIGDARRKNIQYKFLS